jgi:hydroxyacylglutathione hydrolase
MFGKWVQALLDPSASWLLLADDGVELDAISILVDLGFGDLRGHLRGGFGALASHKDELIHTERVDHSALARELGGDQAPYLLDVRQPMEWQAGRIASAPNLPLTEIESRRAEVPTDRRVILQCQGGFRSLIAASILEFHGHEGIVDMAGGFGSWAQAGLQVNPAE